ncbi:MAG: alpha/beta hydrolase [Pseudonocardia sp.]|nr:alpha/beta hydrolase [Pseudonocardia sp.]
MSNFVLVHGSSIGGWYWSEVAQRLENAGHHVYVIEQLPSSGPDPTALGDLATDAAVVKKAVESVGDDVILVGHSYGGMVITELADHPRVAHSVYLAGYWPARGKSAFDLLGAGPPADWVVPQDYGTIRVTNDLDLLRQTLCADVDKDRADADLRRMTPVSIASLTAASSAPDRRHPTTYIITEQDQAVPPAAQEQMAAAANHIERLPSSHQPMVSMPDELATILGRVH